jgi:hypothetical protein
VSRGSRLMAKGQTHMLHRCKRRTSEQRERAGRWPRGGLTCYTGAKGGPVSRGSRPTAKGQTHRLHRHKSRTSEQREQVHGKWADPQPTQVQKEDQ